MTILVVPQRVAGQNKLETFFTPKKKKNQGRRETISLLDMGV